MTSPHTSARLTMVRLEAQFSKTEKLNKKTNSPPVWAENQKGHKTQRRGPSEGPNCLRNNTGWNVVTSSAVDLRPWPLWASLCGRLSGWPPWCFDIIPSHQAFRPTLPPPYSPALNETGPSICYPHQWDQPAPSTMAVPTATCCDIMWRLMPLL